MQKFSEAAKTKLFSNRHLSSCNKKKPLQSVNAQKPETDLREAKISTILL